MKDVSSKDGRTILFVSHNMPAILNLCNKAMVLDWGRNVFAGETEEAVSFYLNNKISSHTQGLEGRTDRLGNGSLVCTALQFLNADNEVVTSAKSGDDLRIGISYILKDKPVKFVYFRLQILDANEGILFTLNNEHTNSAIPVIDASGTIVCTVPRLPLFGGNYYINVQAFSREAGLLDDVDFAAELNVIDGDFFGTGRMPAVKKGMLVPHNWHVNELTRSE